MEKNITSKIIHTPGHSKGSISLLLEEEKSLFTADALIFPSHQVLWLNQNKQLNFRDWHVVR